ncbi:MAG: type III PLP-dependent enzyme [Candidatus Cloacimonetes bacterium]|nr:type III PLP-dependent enzyme [Candidatus Cloacimonadota bacterium]
MYREEYSFKIERYMEPERFERVRKFAEGQESPLLIVDLDIIKARYQELNDGFSNLQVYYALKANPMDEVIMLLDSLGSNFDVASVYELDQLLRLGISPEKMSFGNTIKKARDIRYFHEKGVKLFVTDSESDLRNIAENAPGAKVYFRLLAEGTGADWPLTRKFGAHPDVIFNLILQTPELGLIPWGVSFHVGSQQRDIGQWDDAIARTKYLFDAVLEAGIELQMINLGGGYPARYVDPTLNIRAYNAEIFRFIQEDFGEHIPQIVMEPGRSLVADAGVLVAEIVNIATKAKNNLYKWVFLDVGKFGGLIETIDESIKFPIYFEGEGLADEIILAGPTCDSMDIMYEYYKYQMPESTKPGDRVYIFTTGAYTQSYSSVNFNGFPPLRAVLLPKE